MSKPQTITQKILAAHCGKDYVEPGELIMARVDIALGNDITAPLAIKDFHKVGAKKVFDRARVVLVCDHFAPNKDIASAIHCQQLRNFAREQDLTHFYDGGDMGVEHALLPEQGIVGPGDVIIGADSHTCTYGALGAFATGVGSTDLAAVMATGECWFKVPESIRLVYTGALPEWLTGKDLILHTIGDIGVDGARYLAMEFTGEAIKWLPMADRFSMANMAVEAGAKNGIMAPDEITLDYVKGRTLRPYTLYGATRGRRICWSDLRGQRPGTPGGLPVFARQRGAGFPGGGRSHRSGGDRLLHQRPDRRPASGRQGPQGPPGGQRRAPHRHPRHAPGLAPGHGRGPDDHLHGCRGGGQSAHLRTLPGRAHGHPGPGRDGHRHHQP